MHRGVERVGPVLPVEVPALGGQALADGEDVEGVGIEGAEGHHRGRRVAADRQAVDRLHAGTERQGGVVCVRVNSR